MSTNNLPAHGVLIQLHQLGVFIIGESGIGKSETALQLIQNGAQLVCDDAPIFSYEASNKKLIGSCPEDFKGLIHIRELGILNIKELLGEKTSKSNHSVDFVVQLTKGQPISLAAQLNPSYQHWQYPIDKSNFFTIPGICLYNYPNRNNSQLIDIAVKQFIQLQNPK